MSVDFEKAVMNSRRALDEILRGSADGYKQLYSRRDEITLGNPFGGFGPGWEGVVEQLDRAWGSCRPRRSCVHDCLPSPHEVELGGGA
jgi:hypothetical protein